MKKEIINDDFSMVPAKSYWSDVGRRFLKNRIALLGALILGIIVFMCAAAPLFTQYDPVKDMVLGDMLLPGTPGHILGTDDYGRDIFSRLLYGGRTSVLTGLSVAIVSAAVGVTLGCISGYFGGIIDNLIMRFTDIMMSFPFLIIAIAIMAALGSSQKNIVIALAIVSWPRFARLTRGQVLSIKTQEYVESANTAGYSDMRIMFNHILPNCMGPIIVQLTLAVGSAILSAASLNFLGLGVDASLPDWGVIYRMVHDNLTYEQVIGNMPAYSERRRKKNIFIRIGEALDGSNR